MHLHHGLIWTGSPWSTMTIPPHRPYDCAIDMHPGSTFVCLYYGYPFHHPLADPVLLLREGSAVPCQLGGIRPWGEVLAPRMAHFGYLIRDFHRYHLDQPHGFPSSTRGTGRRAPLPQASAPPNENGEDEAPADTEMDCIGNIPAPPPSLLLFFFCCCLFFFGGGGVCLVLVSCRSHSVSSKATISSHRRKPLTIPVHTLSTRSRHPWYLLTALSAFDPSILPGP